MPIIEDVKDFIKFIILINIAVQKISINLWYGKLEHDSISMYLFMCTWYIYRLPMNIYNLSIEGLLWINH